jgi:heavy metal translocating P-type ATPase
MTPVSDARTSDASCRDLAPAASAPARAGEARPGLDPERRHDHDHDVHGQAPFEAMSIARIVVATLGAAATWFKIWEPFPQISVIGAAALLFAGWPVLREAVENVLERRMTMELSMTIAIAAAAAIGEWFTALVVLLFVLVAEELEHMTVAKGRVAIKELVDFLPAEARVRREGGIVTIALADLRPGEHVFVSPGEKIPVDGLVVEGDSAVDQSRITGESMPADKHPGSTVFAGSINQMGALEIQVERVGRDTSFGRIIEAVERAEESRAPVQRLADQLAGYLVYAALAAAIATWFMTGNIRDTISVIIVAGACGVAAGTPLAVLGGVGRAAKLGSIVKGGVHLETLGRVDTVVLDKTGTLTVGEPQAREVVAAPGFTVDEVVRLAAAAELHSEHPLARAVVREAARRGIVAPEPEAARFVIARGVIATVEGRTVLVGARKLLTENGVEPPPREAAQVGSDLLVAADGRYAGAIRVADRLREEAKAALAELGRMNIRTLLLTGDAEPVARAVAEEVGVAEFGAEMLPEEKLARVKALVRQGRVVAMVGDGVNDAPALTAASVGVAMGSGADVSKESADVVLIGDDLGKLVETLKIARKTRGIIWQNFAGTIGVDALGILLAAFGFINPLIAAFIHVGSELAFILNSARLLALKGEEAGRRRAE